MATKGSKPNQYLNRLLRWHAKGHYKRQTSKARRRDGKARIQEQRGGDYRRCGR